MKWPDWCHPLFMENVSVAFVIWYLTTPPQTIKTLPFIIKYFEPETSMPPGTLTPPLCLSSSQSGILSDPLPSAHSPQPSLREGARLRPGARQPVYSAPRSECKSKSPPLTASTGPHECTWPAGLLSLRLGFESSGDEVCAQCSTGSLLDQGLLVTGWQPPHPTHPSTIAYPSGLGVLLCCIV